MTAPKFNFDLDDMIPAQPLWGSKMKAGKSRKFEPSIEFETAHDIRHLHMCPHCQVLGDDRYMVNLHWPSYLHHGGCALEILGISGLLLLDDAELDKLTIGEIGVEAMRAIIDARAKRGKP